jgi:hypothetical protein
MPINACSINGFTIDARRCRDKFQDLIPILHPPVTSTNPSSNGGWTQKRPPSYYRGINPPTWDDKQVPTPTELDRVIVTVEIFGKKGSDEQQIVPRLDLVTVTDIHVESGSVGVNIENFQVTNDADTV